MEKSENKSIINWELHQKLRVKQSKIVKEFKPYKKPTLGGFFKLGITWLRNKFLSFRN
jgi:hypothetical protein